MSLTSHSLEVHRNKKKDLPGGRGTPRDPDCTMNEIIKENNAFTDRNYFIRAF